ncbi:MAG: hypothetical protein HIU91_16260 [Acidobacteria bacterium]|nr:hypothetical protein [Acidobacteriota bacterium]
MALGAIKRRLLDIDKGLATGAPLDAVRANLAFVVGMVDELVRQEEKLPAARQLGQLGGLTTAKRGPDYFRELAARRKTHGGGRPRKNAI